jgi:hypothetical protein
MDLFASLSVKGGITKIAQDSLQWNIDWPGLFGGNVRLNPQVAYVRTINEGYFGLGNDSSDAPPPAPNPDPEGYYQFVENLFYARTIARIDFARPFAVMSVVTYRYVVPQALVATKLALDENPPIPQDSPHLYGTRPLSLVAVGGGFAYDSRDSEIFTKKGMYHQLGLRLEEGIPTDAQVRYGEAGAVLTGFVPITGPLIFAGRFIADFQFGHVPFYDLFVAGPFQLKELPGGSAGIRGVPVGRYLGPIKVVGNAELRALFAYFTLLKQKISLGCDAFLDAGRVWSDYTFKSSLDGRGFGLKYGVGGGLLWIWGQAAVFRMEVAYSPDAVAVNRGLPIGIYVEDGTSF